MLATNQQEQLDIIESRASQVVSVMLSLFAHSEVFACTNAFGIRTTNNTTT
jgi:hypothetical protein